MTNLILLLFSVLLLSGCTKKAEATPDSVDIPEEITDAVSVTTVPIEEPVIEITTIETESEESLTLKDISEEIQEEIITIKEPQTSIQKEYDYDQLFPDSIWTEYMIKRGDYLSLIAYKEYNNANEWRRIYQWNREHWEEKGIGPDRDNPNFIYPYRELDLKKPAKNAIEWAYAHYIHEIGSGETLWTIAKKVYGDELAWVVLFWDNENVLNSQNGKLIPGMQLKVRSELWPDVE